jgi:hypothetical protein
MRAKLLSIAFGKTLIPLVSLFCTPSQAFAQRGKVSDGGGGAIYRESFYNTTAKAVQALSGERSYVINHKVIIWVNLADALRSVSVFPVEDQLYDRNADPVDFYNDPLKREISFNIHAWDSLSEIKRYKFGLHELLGVMGFGEFDKDYGISNKLTELAVAQMNKHLDILPYSGKSTVSAVHTLKNGVDPLRFIIGQQKSGDTMFITNECEIYETGFQGACIVNSSKQNGLINQEVWIIRHGAKQICEAWK